MSQTESQGTHTYCNKHRGMDTEKPVFIPLLTNVLNKRVSSGSYLSIFRVHHLNYCSHTVSSTRILEDQEASWRQVMKHYPHEKKIVQY